MASLTERNPIPAATPCADCGHYRVLHYRGDILDAAISPLFR